MKRVPDDLLPKTHPTTPMRPPATPEPPKATAVQPTKASSAPPKTVASVGPTRTAAAQTDAHPVQPVKRATPATLASANANGGGNRQSQLTKTGTAEESGPVVVPINYVFIDPGKRGAATRPISGTGLTRPPGTNAKSETQPRKAGSLPAQSGKRLWTPGRAGRVEVSTGLSPSYDGPPTDFGPVKVSVSLHATATLTWSGGMGKADVSFNPDNGHISIADGPLTVADPGHLQRAASKWEHIPATDFLHALDAPRKSRYSIAGPHTAPPTVDLVVGKTTVHAPIHDVEVVQHVKFENGRLAVEIEVSTNFQEHVRGYGKIKVEYSITAEGKLETRPGHRPTLPPIPDDVLVALIAAALIAIQRRSPEGELDPGIVEGPETLSPRV